MRVKKRFLAFLLISFIPFTTFSMPQRISPPGERMVLVSPTEHAWGAYLPDGTLVRSGMASLGANWCPDMNSQCHTETGSFRVRSLGGPGCVSPTFPIPHGGSPMPYCMYFNSNQALHGSYHVVNGNISHGCVRLHVNDARWLRFNFVRMGTLVQIQSY